MIATGLTLVTISVALAAVVLIFAIAANSASTSGLGPIGVLITRWFLLVCAGLWGSGILVLISALWH